MTTEEALSNIMDGMENPADHDEALAIIRDAIHSQNESITQLTQEKDSLKNDYDALKETYTRRFKEEFLQGKMNTGETVIRNEETEEIKLEDLDLFNGSTE